MECNNLYPIKGDTMIFKDKISPEEETISKTVSISSSGCNLDKSYDGIATLQIDPRYPVRGHLLNVLDDYVIFPITLGEGHYGCVRECIHRDTRKTYACKSIDKSKTRRLDHLKREVKLLSEMEHDGIMKMIDYYEDEDYIHIITEKYEGGELFSRIKNNTTSSGCLTECKASHIMKSLLEVVAYLHENEIVHRDLKPENIMFESSQEDSIKLIDFGLARKHDRSEGLMTNPVGTVYFMAPELLGGLYDKSCDMWSLGVIAYLILCGYPPFNGKTDPAIFKAIKRGRFHFSGQAWTRKSDECKDFIKCLLRMDKRYTAEEALMHPWIKNLGGRRQQKHQANPKSPGFLRYLRMP